MFIDSWAGEEKTIVEKMTANIVVCESIRRLQQREKRFPAEVTEEEHRGHGDCEVNLKLAAMVVVLGFRSCAIAD